MSARRLRTGALAATIAAFLSGCSGEKPAAGNDTAVSLPSPPRGAHAPLAALASVWDTAAGQVFLLPGPNLDEGYLVDPLYVTPQRLDTMRVDSARVIGTDLDFITGEDSVLRGRIVSLRPDTAAATCAMWPLVTIEQDSHEPLRQPWQVGFPHGRVRSVSFDSLPGMTRADSARLTIAVARVASRAEGDTVAAFRGRPYVVRQANLIRLDDRRRVVVAEVLRAVNQEANPLQEQLLLILEADSVDGGFQIGFQERQVALEEALQSIDLSAVLQLPTGTWALLVRREVGDGLRIVLFERPAAGRWIVRWRSAYAGC
jgi:hypothetical protein